MEEELQKLMASKKELEKQILKGRLDLHSHYNQVCLQILKLQFPIRFKWSTNKEPKP
jgi:hypothetical protein